MKTFKPGFKMHFFNIIVFPFLLTFLFNFLVVTVAITGIFNGGYIYLDEHGGTFWITFTIIVVSVDLLTVLIFILRRKFYKIRYEVDEIYLTKYYGKEIIFKIKKEDIENVYVQKAKWFEFFVFLAEVFLSMIFVTPGKYNGLYSSNMSFTFHKCEIIRRPKTIKKYDIEYTRVSLKPDDQNDAFEVSDYFLYKQSLEICKLLGKAPIIVKKANGYIEYND